MQACRNRRNTSLREWESSHALVEHLRTFAYGHSHYGPGHHRRRFQRRFWCIQKVGVKCSTAKVCKWKHGSHEKNAPQRRLRGLVQVLNEQFEPEPGSGWIQQRGALRRHWSRWLRRTALFVRSCLGRRRASCGRTSPRQSPRQMSVCIRWDIGNYMAAGTRACRWFLCACSPSTLRRPAGSAVSSVCRPWWQGTGAHCPFSRPQSRLESSTLIRGRGTAGGTENLNTTWYSFWQLSDSI